MSGPSDVHWRNWPHQSVIESAIPMSESSLNDVASLLDGVLRTWTASDVFSAKSVLYEYPALATNRSAVVAIAAEEYLRRRQAGWSVERSRFAAEFGDLSDSVVRATEVMDFFLSDRGVAESDAVVRWPGVGDRVAHFELLEALGGGLLSRVYVARDMVVAQRHVVVKLTRSSEREILALGKLSHQGIVPILSMHFDSARKLNAIVMPFRSRVTLLDAIGIVGRIDGAGRRDVDLHGVEAEVSRRNSVEPRPPEDVKSHRPTGHSWHSEWVARTGIDIAIALHSSHRQGVLHCDVKPSNVVLVDPFKPVLVDFNLCVGHDARRVAVGGTLPYMSPEQLRGDPLDERSDVYSLAATLYHMLATRPPFGGPDVTISRSLAARLSLEQCHGSEERQLAKIDARLAQVILKGLAHNPCDRYLTAADLADALLGCLRLRVRLARSVRRQKRKVQTVTCAASFLLLGLGIWESNRDPPHLRAAKTAIAAAQEGDYWNSMAYAHQSLDFQTDYLPALIMRGGANLQVGRFDDARKDLGKAATLTRNAEVWALFAYAIYRDEDDLDAMHAAIAAMNEAQNRGLVSALLINNRGYCRERLQDLEGAEADFKEAVRIDPECGVAWLNLAHLDLRKSLQSEQPPNVHFIENALKRLGSSCDAHKSAVLVYIQYMRRGGDGEAPLLIHCQRALELGLTWEDLSEMLKRVPKPSQLKLRGELSKFQENCAPKSYEPTERFVVPCEASAVAANVMEGAASAESVTRSYSHQLRQ